MSPDLPPICWWVMFLIAVEIFALVILNFLIRRKYGDE